MNEIDADGESGHSGTFGNRGASGASNALLAAFFAQRKLQLALALLAGVLLLDVIGTQMLGFTLTGLDHVYWASPVALTGIAMAVLSRQTRSKLRRFWARTSVALICLYFLTVFSFAAFVLQDCAIAIHFDLVDNRLEQIDDALGFRWHAAYPWFENHPPLFDLLRTCYRVYGWQVALLPVLLAYKDKPVELTDYLLLFCATVVLSILISTAVPASNPYIHFGRIGPHDLSEWSQFASIREGMQRTIDLNDNQGLISLPSLHAAHAVIFSYVVRHLRGWNLVIPAVNVLMIVSALPFGGHYLIDIIAGIALAATAIHLSRHLRSTREHDRSLTVVSTGSDGVV
ncbi:phosphatase PAP2 family protein [Pandoraea sp. NPDC090278]|uniref:phosphatase PAP2 family protein n=1 Tax=Pandoraea sp. NPDC090278 TaxID=3364391 RepID=UPI00383AFEB8